MTEYRRRKIPGATYFFTVITYNRCPIFNHENAWTLLRKSIHTVKTRYPFKIDAIVLLPEHLHTLWILPEGDEDYSLRWNLIKRKFSRMYKQCNISQPISFSIRKKRECAIWQRRFWEHCIRDEDDYRKHMDYIHYNPVKHNHVSSPKDWPWSTFHKYVELGWYMKEWGESEVKNLSIHVAGEMR